MHVALLRGVNVGGGSRLAMADLAAAFEACGASGVRTYIQSGNVIFDAPDGSLEDIVAAAEIRISTQLGSKNTLVVRAASRLRTIAAYHPFQSRALDHRQLHIGFLREQPSPELVDRLSTNRSPPNRWMVRNCEIYLLLPHGVAKSKLSSAYFESVLGIPCAIRNWRTVRTLAAMTEPGAG